MATRSDRDEGIAATFCPECGAPGGRIHAFSCSRYPEVASAACSYCGDEDLPTRPLVTDEGLTIFVCPDCANGEDE